MTDDRIVDVITRTLEGPPAHAMQWTTRGLADVAGLSKATIARIWQTFGLQSHRLDTFKLSADPQFVEKVRDIVGLYFFPPDPAIVLSTDEKSQVQALDRTRPLLPMRPGIPARQTHGGVESTLDLPAAAVFGSSARWRAEFWVVPTKNSIRRPGLMLRRSERSAVDWAAAMLLIVTLALFGS